MQSCRSVCRLAFLGSEAFERIHHFLQKDRGCEEEALYLRSTAMWTATASSISSKLQAGSIHSFWVKRKSSGSSRMLTNALWEQNPQEGPEQAFPKAFMLPSTSAPIRGIQRGSTSVGSVAVELAERIFDGLEGKRVMVIGAGDTSEKTARRCFPEAHLNSWSPTAR